MEQWKDFNLSKQELHKGLIIEESEACEDDIFHRTLAAKLWTNNTYNAKAFKQTTIEYSWRLKNQVDVEDLDKNLYLFRFSTKKDAENVLKNGPWSFKGVSLLNKEKESCEEVEENEYSFGPWLKASPLPKITYGQKKDSSSSSCRKALFACTSSSKVEEAEPIIDKEMEVEQNKDEAKRKEPWLDFEEREKEITNNEVERMVESLGTLTLSINMTVGEDKNPES